jgi:hypothetical protein
MLALVAAPIAVAFAPCSDVLHRDVSNPRLRLVACLRSSRCCGSGRPCGRCPAGEAIRDR